MSWYHRTVHYLQLNAVSEVRIPPEVYSLALSPSGNTKCFLVIWCWQYFIETTVRTNYFQVYTISSNCNPHLWIEIIFENIFGENWFLNIWVHFFTVSLIFLFFFPLLEIELTAFFAFPFIISHLLLILMPVLWRDFQQCLICYRSCLFYSSLFRKIFSHFQGVILFCFGWSVLFSPLIFSACFIMGGILKLLSLSECWQLLHNFHVLEASVSKIPP